jgi:hypothetical protein
MTSHLPALAGKAATASAVVRSRRARQRAADLAPILATLRSEGAVSLRALAARLTETGIAAPRAAAWSHVAVKRTLDRIER